ncbi:uncharacterized protein LOC132722876 [Ruditapes philippinarum]|uniref:uncharacterized protein LOC132722876 n=1 Tax=Ruditapes philippinarum TaxID=129788 RepID=UPI00295A860A|nr:uncharacterized protein LOC132722876 [Ruditapes philippinarum]
MFKNESSVMEFVVAIVVSLYLLGGVDCHRFDGEYTKEKYCPVSVNHGDWEIDYDDGYRCILRCDKGFEPSDCHVIRRGKDGRWARNIPTCVEPPMVSGKTLVAVGAGIGAVVAAPYALAAAGFTGAGVAACSLASWLQGSATAAGSVFAVSQSAGAAGFAATTQAGIFGAISSTTRYAAELLSGCEEE